MIVKNTAQRLVTEKINADYNIDDDELIIIDDLTIEKDYGWIFFYNSKRYLETEDISYLIAGNSPILVEKENGSLYELGTAFPVDEYIKQYETTRAHFFSSHAQNTETIGITRENEILNNVDEIS